MRPSRLAPAALALLALAAAGPAPAGPPAPIPVASPSPGATLLFAALAVPKAPRPLTSSQEAFLDQVVRHERQGESDQAREAWDRFARDYFTPQTARDARALVNHVVYLLMLQDDAPLRALTDESRFRSAQDAVLRRYVALLERALARAKAGQPQQVQLAVFTDPYAQGRPAVVQGPRKLLSAADIEAELSHWTARREAVAAAAARANDALLSRIAPKAEFLARVDADTQAMLGAAASPAAP